MRQNEDTMFDTGRLGMTLWPNAGPERRRNAARPMLPAIVRARRSDDDDEPPPCPAVIAPLPLCPASGAAERVLEAA